MVNTNMKAENSPLLRVSAPDEMEIGDTVKIQLKPPAPTQPTIKPKFIPPLITSICLGLVSGTLYGFGRYSSHLKTKLSLSQIQIQRFGILLDTGNYIGHPVTGYFYDRYGARFSCIAAAVVVFVAYGLIHMGLQNHTEGGGGVEDRVGVLASLWLYDVSFFMVGFGSGLGYIAALGSVTRNFQSVPHFLGRAVGFVAAGYGMSSTLVGLTYHWVGLDYFFLLWAILVAVMNLIGSVVFKERKEEEEDAGSIAMTVSQHSSMASLDFELDFVDATEKKKVSNWTTWRKLDFWILTLAFALNTGCGLFLINNISTIVQSHGAKDGLAGSLVFLLSIANVFGRLAMGLLKDQQKKTETSASSSADVTGDGHSKSCSLTLFRNVCMVISVGLFISAIAGSSTATLALIVTVMLCLSAYGASWVLIVNILSERFGTVTFGKDYGLLAMGPAVSGMLFNSVSAWLYTSHATAEDSGDCVGLVCYRGAFILTSFSAFLASVLIHGLRG